VQNNRGDENETSNYVTCLACSKVFNTISGERNTRLNRSDSGRTKTVGFPMKYMGTDTGKSSSPIALPPQSTA